MSIEFIEKDQDWESETTLYKFGVDDETFYIEDCNGFTRLLDEKKQEVKSDIEFELINQYREQMSH